jgi:predicted nucleic acid-binding Zn ribbon protein
MILNSGPHCAAIRGQVSPFPPRENGRVTSHRFCPTCGAPIDTTPRRGHPRRFCSDRCRWRHGHLAARDRHRIQDAASWAWTTGEVAARLHALDPFTQA